MKVILVDDDPVMHLIMRKMLAKHPEVRVEEAFSDASSASAYLSGHDDIELAFVDISMPGENGLTFAEQMEKTGSRTRIAFVTSHKQYALRAYELSVVDYLVKPVSQERLERTVNRVLAGRKTAGAPGLGSLAASGGSSGLSITALGDFSVQSEAGRVKWISNKSAELFAYLLINRGKRVSRSRLVSDIFGGMTRDNAEKYLNTAVYQLRKSLEPFGLRDRVRSENDGYALELENAAIDYELFEKQATADTDDLEALLRAEKLYTGDLFGSKAYVWAIHETERLVELYASFVRKVAEALLAARRPGDALKLLLKLYARNSLDETVVGLMLQAHASEGNKKALTARYTDYVRLLNRELGIRPSMELLLLYDSLVSKLPEARGK